MIVGMLYSFILFYFSKLKHSLSGAGQREAQKTQEAHETYKTWKANEPKKIRKFQGSQVSSQAYIISTNNWKREGEEHQSPGNC